MSVGARLLQVQGANPTQQYTQGGQESVSALKERTRRLSDRELLQAIRSHSQAGAPQHVCDDEASSDADDESTDDLQVYQTKINPKRSARRPRRLAPCRSCGVAVCGA